MDTVQITTDVDGMIREIRTAARWRPSLRARVRALVVGTVLRLIAATLVLTDAGLVWCERTQAGKGKHRASE